MLYQDYKEKINRRVKIRRTLRKYRVAIICAISLIALLMLSFMVTKGMVFGNTLENGKIEYGDKPAFEASAIFSDVRYQFATAQGEEWTNTVPVLLGEYKMRVVSNGVFGERYSDEQYFSIVPRKISVVAKEDTVVYGEVPSVSASLAFDDRVECDSFVFDDDTMTKTAVTPVKAGVKVTDKNGRDVTDCYEVSVVAKEITFTKRDITLTVGSVESEYNGEEFSHEAWQVTEGSLAYNDDVVKVVDGSFTTETGVGEYENKGEFRVVRGSVDITHHYNITKVSGTVTILQRPVTVYTNSIEKTYTGQEWYDIGYTVDKNTPLLEGHTISVSGYNRLSVAGEIENLLSFVIRDKDGNDVTANYGFTHVCGRITVLAREITVQTESGTAEYDGGEHTFEGYGIVSETALASGHALKLVNKTVFVNATKGQENLLELDVVDENGNSVLSNYKITYQNGTVTVTKKKITVQSGDLFGTYNGSEQRAETAFCEKAELCEGHTLEATFKTGVTECLKTAIDNEFDLIIRDGAKNDVTENYEVTRVYGKLQLSPLAIAIRTGSAYKVYDGEPLYEHSFEYVNGSATIVSGHRVEYVNTTEQTNADVVDNVFEIKILAGDTDKSHNYDVSYKYGELEVARRPFVVTSLSLPEKTFYDGKRHRYEHYEITPADGYDVALLEGHEASVEFLLTSYVEFAADEGNNRPNLFNVEKITDTKTNEDVTGNYAPTQIYGLLRLEKRPIRFESGSINEIYDGEIHYNTECYDVVNDLAPEDPLASVGLAEGHAPDARFWGIGVAGVIDVCDGVNYFALHGILDAHGNNVYDNYKYNGYVYGKIVIEPRPITLISKDGTKMYDGTPLTNTEYSVGGMGLVKDERLAYSNNASITDVLLDADGNVVGIENSFEFGVSGGKASNYIVTGTEFGTLTVTKRPITLTSNDGTKVYDGNYLYNDRLTVGGEGLVGRDRVECVNYAAITDVVLDENGLVTGVYNTFGFNIYKGDGSDGGHNYEVTKYETGLLTVTKRPATVEINSVSREYNGLPLTPDGFTYPRQYGKRGIISGQTLELELYGSITKVGSETIGYGTPYVYEIVDGVAVDRSHNYDITVLDGTLTVTTRKIVLNGRFEEQEYTGALINPSFDGSDVSHATVADIAGLGTGDSITVIFTSGARTELGTSAVRIKESGWTITNSEGEDVTYCYEVIDISEGELTVIPRKIYIRPNGNIKEYYDGAAVRNDGYTVDGFLYWLGHTISLEISGEQVNHGYSYAEVVPGSIVIRDKNGRDASRYYEIAGMEKGVLQVLNKRPITVTSASDFFFYDGYAHKNEDYEIVDNCTYPMQRAEDFVVTFTNGIMILPGEYDNMITVRAFVRGTSTETTDNYEITYNYGKIVIGGVDIEVKTEGGEKVYDGTPLTNGSTTVQFPNGKPEGLEVNIVATGEQTNVGTSQNTYRIEATLNGSPFPSEGFNVLSEELGELTVTLLNINISTLSGETVYDGAPFVYNEYETDFYETEASKHLTLSVNTAMLVDIGRRDNTVTAVDLLDANGMAVPRDNFTYTVEEVGTLTMYAAHIEIESDRETFEYDGTAKNHPYHKSPSGHINPNHRVVSSGYMYFTDVGVHENVFVVDVVDENGASVIEFYPDIELIYDTVTIEKRKIEIEAPTVVERYENGKVIYAPNEIVLPNEYLEELNDNLYGNIYSYEIGCNMAEIAYATELGVDVEYYIPTEYFYITLNGERLDMSNFEVSCLPGYLRFSDKLVEIEIFDVNGYYDGNRLEYFADDWDLAEGQLPQGYWLELDLSGIGLSEAGSIDFDEMLEYLLSSGKLCVYRYNERGWLEDMTHYFEFKLVGTPLTLNKAELILTAGSATKYYDGNALTCDTYTITGGGLEDGHVISKCEISGSITEVGYELNQIVNVVIVDTNTKNTQGLPKDITSNYHITVISGTLTVTEDKDK